MQKNGSLKMINLNDISFFVVLLCGVFFIVEGGLILIAAFVLAPVHWLWRFLRKRLEK